MLSLFAPEIDEHGLIAAAVDDILDCFEVADLHGRAGVENFGGFLEHLGGLDVGLGGDDGGFGEAFLDGCGLEVALHFGGKDNICVWEEVPLMNMFSM